MRAVVWQGPEEMTVEEVPEPAVEAGTVIVRPEAAGICGSEVEGYLGKMGNRTPPLVMGHEFAGTVVDVGEGVDANLLGQSVAVNPLSSCGGCRLCREGLTNVCPKQTLIGIHHPGGFAELVRAPAKNVYPLPENLSDAPRVGALVEPLANGVHAIRLGTARLETYGEEPVKYAVVIGAGAIGLMCLQAAGLSGIPNMRVVEPHEARREQALRLGAHTSRWVGLERHCTRARGAWAQIWSWMLSEPGRPEGRLSNFCALADGPYSSACTTTRLLSGFTKSCAIRSCCRAPTPTPPTTTSRPSNGSSRVGLGSESCRQSCRSRGDRTSLRS
jgi:hypothetical protein